MDTCFIISNYEPRIGKQHKQEILRMWLWWKLGQIFFSSRPSHFRGYLPPLKSLNQSIISNFFNLCIQPLKLFFLQWKFSPFKDNMYIFRYVFVRLKLSSYRRISNSNKSAPTLFPSPPLKCPPRKIFDQKTSENWTFLDSNTSRYLESRTLLTLTCNSRQAERFSISPTSPGISSMELSSYIPLLSKKKL